MKLILFGAPGAGKGTQASKIADRLGVPTISTGNIIREAIAAGTELGKKVKEYSNAGKLVPDEVVIGMLSERISRPDCANGFILDGFPRTIAQAEALDALGVEIECALSLEVPDEDIERRMTGRRSCPACGETYHIIYNPPTSEGRCDKCSAELIRRADDAPETVQARLAVYHEQTEPVKAYYDAKGKLKTVDGRQAVEKVTEDAYAALGI